MARRRLPIVLALTGALATGACGGGAHRPPTSYAYTTERQLVVMRGDDMVARVPRVFDLGDPMKNKVVWTNDGRYVAMLMGADLLQLDREDERLVAVDAKTGKLTRLPCPGCLDLTPVRDSRILAEAYEDANEQSVLREFSLTADGPRAMPAAELSPGFAGGQMLASSAALMLTARSEFANGEYLQRLGLANLDDNVNVDVGAFDSNDYMPAAAEDIDGREPRFAVAFRADPGECGQRFPIFLLDHQGTTGTATATDMSSAEPPGLGGDGGPWGGVEVNDISWGADGHAYATISAWTCDQTKRAEDEKMVIARGSTVWRLDGRRWVDAGLGAATKVRILGPDDRLVVRIPDCIGPVHADNAVLHCNRGTLFRVRDGKRVVVARGVVDIATPPLG